MADTWLKKYIIPVSLLLCLLFVAIWQRNSLFSPPPSINVLLITLDTTRADHLGCYGYKKQISPNIDKLAAKSFVFDMAIAQAAVIPVSHASILTGLEPYHHGLRVLHGLVANKLQEKRWIFS